MSTEKKSKRPKKASASMRTETYRQWLEWQKAIGNIVYKPINE